MIRNQQGGESSISTSYKVDGSFVESVRKDFGKYTPQSFRAIQNSVGDYNPTPGPGINAEVLERLKAFARVLNDLKAGMDLEHKPENIYYFASTQALYDLTEAFLKSDAATSEKLALIQKNENTSKALFEISAKGILNVSTSLTPFVNDARDMYELVTGRDMITGESIDGFGRVVTAVALVAGNGNIFRKAVDKLKDSFFKKGITQALPGIPGLKYTGSGTWSSDAGLVYKQYNGPDKTRLRHVLRHATPKPSDAAHTVFNTASPKDVPKLLDEAWLKRGNPVPGPGGRDNYVIDMGRTIGTKGEKKILISVEKGTSVIVTAFPTKP